MNPKLAYAIANGLNVAEISSLDLPQTNSNPGLRNFIA
jgi:hypothetical protein